jgi:UDP-2,3-diacylglucosamine pyrophosphatase LpxH
MILFASDLHLTDGLERPTFSPSFFFQKLDTIIETAATCAEPGELQNVKIVFLGDIFEILKSRHWLDAHIRPWEASTPKHVDTVEAIFKSIVAANSEFFQNITALKGKYPFINFTYLPGNHDRPLNTDMGVKARTLLQKLVPLQEKGGEIFQLILTDPTHKLIAKHGHQWDSSNRYDETGGRTVAFGDAIVIELILQLPLLFRSSLKIADETDPRLEYLYELDNVRPHTLRVIAQWLNSGLETIVRGSNRTSRVLDEVVTEVVKKLKDLASNVAFESFALNSAKRKSAAWLLMNEITVRGFLKVAHRVPWGERESGSERDFALEDFSKADKKYQFLVSGHTHAPMVVPIDTGDNTPRTYVNTGTWRRVRPVSRSAKENNLLQPFACWEEGCIATVFAAEEQKRLHLPPFELYRFTRGH